jgi:hypothetical protein
MSGYYRAAGATVKTKPPTPRPDIRRFRRLRRFPNHEPEDIPGLDLNLGLNLPDCRRWPGRCTMNEERRTRRIHRFHRLHRFPARHSIPLSLDPSISLPVPLTTGPHDHLTTLPPQTTQMSQTPAPRTPDPSDSLAPLVSRFLSLRAHHSSFIAPCSSPLTHARLLDSGAHGRIIISCQSHRSRRTPASSGSAGSRSQPTGA